MYSVDDKFTDTPTQIKQHSVLLRKFQVDVYSRSLSDIVTVVEFSTSTT